MDKIKNDNKIRCRWSYGAGKTPDKRMIAYHDTRWGKPEHNDNELFAMLVLEGMQAGLSWAIILKKEAAYRAAFDGLNPAVVAAYSDKKIDSLMQAEGIIKNRNKINSVITNARAFLKVQQEFGSFNNYIWGFTGGRVIDNHLQDEADVPAKNALSEKISADLKKRGFKFVGPVIIYSYLQAIGVINDHTENCDFR